MSDLIDRQMSIDAMRKIDGMATLSDGDTVIRKSAVEYVLLHLPSAHPDNQTNLCDSCNYSYPDCPSKNDDVIFGNCIGNDNICACNKYKPPAQPEIIRCKECANADENYHCDYMTTWNYGDCFCSYGKRRNDERSD